MPGNRPRARVKTTGGGSGIGARRRPAGGGIGGSSSGTRVRSAGGRGGSMGCLTIALIVLVVFFMLRSCAGHTATPQENISQGNGVSYGWYENSNSGVLDTSVAYDAREKFTTIKGDGTDTVTIMVYMCGTDLESQAGMATSDLMEMLNADVGENVNLLVYTGGCKKWNNNVVSARSNEIYQIQNGGISRISNSFGSGSMTDADNLESFIKWCKTNYPANRMDLIFWDHGGGTISGYGYDEKYPRTGSMTLDEIDSALKGAGVKFDFVGFDTCLMATTETALMVGKYADYMIASEESEPGTGWYYTNWLTELSSDTSMATLNVGKKIVDDFISMSEKQCRGQEATLSVIDLAELTQTVPGKLSAFSRDTSSKISGGDYAAVSSARSSAREFAAGNGIDQIDLVHFAKMLNSSTSKDLANAILSAVKYNKTSSNSVNAYGLSIYFPYSSWGYVDTIINTFNKIGMDQDYAKCIKQFAQMGVTGQAASGGYSTPYSSLNGDYDSGYTGQFYAMDDEDLYNAISQMLSGEYRDYSKLGIEGLDETNTRFMSEDALDPETVTEYIKSDRLEAGDLVWKKGDDGSRYIELTEEQWENVSMVDKAVFYDTGEGYLDLGLDNLFDFDANGNLVADTDKDWLAINGQPVAYYHTTTTEFTDEEYRISGFVPVEVNGQSAYLILEFDQDNEDGRIAGVRYQYGDETETEGKTLEGLKKGDVVEFVYDLYTYDGNLQDSYIYGDPMTVVDPEDIEIFNAPVGDGEIKIMYCFTDIFGQEYWTDAIK
jgi:hypothetical protein